MSVLVSIIVPVFNSSEYLDDCIRSLVQQSLNNIEIIIVDDASTDNSLSICEQWKKRDQRIKLVLNEHEGVSRARNIGIDNANGEWISFVDSDDFAEPNMIETLLGFSDEKDIIIGGFNSIKKNARNEEHFYDGNRCFNLSDQAVKEMMIKDAIIKKDRNSTNIGVPWGRLYKREFIERNGLRFVPGLPRMQDMIFNITAFSSNPCVGYTDKPVYNYRLRTKSLTSAYMPEFNTTALWIIGLLEEQLNRTGNSALFDEVLYAKRFSLFMETVKLELIPKESIYSGTYKKMQKMKEYKSLFLDYSRIKSFSVRGMYLTTRGRIAMLLLNCKLDWFVFIILMIRNRIKYKERFI